MERQELIFEEKRGPQSYRLRQESINKSVQRAIGSCHDSFSTSRHFHVANVAACTHAQLHENDVMLKTSRDRDLCGVAHSGGYGLLVTL